MVELGNGTLTVPNEKSPVVHVNTLDVANNAYTGNGFHKRVPSGGSIGNVSHISDILPESPAAPVIHRDETAERGSWAGKVEFILAIIGMAVGLGNVWRFPYLCYKNGGGAFLVPYVIMLVFIGIPMFFFELALGQFASRGPITVWKVAPIAKGIGYAMVAVTAIPASYYAIIITWSLYYLFASMTSQLPWSECGQIWNDEKCLETSMYKQLRLNETWLNETLDARNLTSIKDFETPSDQYYNKEVLQISEGIHDMGAPVWTLVCCLFLVWLTIFLVLCKGVASLGKVVYVVAIFPYFMMTALLIRGVTLDGAQKGLDFYLNPDPAKLLEVEVWSDAATQIFFSLVAGSGGLIAMGSYNPFHNNCLRDALIVPVVNCLTSFYCGFAIFSVLGYIAEQSGKEVEEVAADGPGLVFVVYPEALAQMPLPPLWSILFFLMMIMLGFSSIFAMMEVVFVSLLDEYSSVLRATKMRPVIFRGVTCVVMFLIGLSMVSNGGFYLFTLVDASVGGFPLLFVAPLSLIAITWVYGLGRFGEDIALMIGKKPNYYFQFCWAVLAPLILLAIIIIKSIEYKPVSLENYVYPEWADGFGWVIVAAVLIWVPVFAVYALFQKGLWPVVRAAAAPSDDWGPVQEEDRGGRYAKDNIEVKIKEQFHNSMRLGHMNDGYADDRISHANSHISLDKGHL